MVICFDFDGTIDDIDLHRLAAKMIREKNEVWIVTARRENEHSKGVVKKVIDRLGISEYQVIYCNEKPKWEILKGLNADIYIDNITDEFDALKAHSNVIPLLW